MKNNSYPTNGSDKSTYRGKRLLPDDDFDPTEDFPEEELPSRETHAESYHNEEAEAEIPPVQDEADSAQEPAEESPSSAGNAPSKVGGFFSRIQDLALDLTDQVLDWRDDMTDRFNDIAADPENDSIAAKMIRGSDNIVSGIAEQERETEEIADETAARRAAMSRPEAEVLNEDGTVPKYVFYNLEDAPTGNHAGTPIPLEYSTILDGKNDASAPVTSSAVAQTPEADDPVDVPMPEGRSAAPTVNDPYAEPVADAELDALFSRRTSSSERRPRGGFHPFPRLFSRDTKSAAHRPVRKTAKPAPATPPSQAEYKQGVKQARDLQYRLFLGTLALVSVVGLLFGLRSTYSQRETRALTEFPPLSVASLWNGSYFSQFDQWNADTYPARDVLSGIYDGFDTLLGFTGSAADNAEAAEAADEVLEDGSTIEAPTITAEDNAESAVSSQSTASDASV